MFSVCGCISISISISTDMGGYCMYVRVCPSKPSMTINPILMNINKLLNAPYHPPLFQLLFDLDV